MFLHYRLGKYNAFTSDKIGYHDWAEFKQRHRNCLSRDAARYDIKLNTSKQLCE